MARGIYHATADQHGQPDLCARDHDARGGAGLDGLLRHRHFDVHGILNGLDYDEWNPATDTRLAANYDLDRLARAAANKRALQARADLPQRDDVPLVGDGHAAWTGKRGWTSPVT